MRIIPAIDIVNGKCVRLTQGDFSSKVVYDDSPLDVAKRFEDAGLKFLHVVDLDGAKAGEVVNWKILDTITSNTKLTVDFGGGVKREEDIHRLLNSGISQVNLGSIAINRPYKIFEWIEKFGRERIILSADVREEKVAINGWQENSNVELIPFIGGFSLQGLQYITCTDIATDGMLSGPNVSLYEKIIREFPSLNVIASGGVSSMDDIKKLNQVKVEGVIIGKALYENRIGLKDLSEIS